ncbi:MAG TPA: OPT/YSL family transporter [Phycisphaerae bacterium]|nr:OPT/YSL family transporter [Phycisphaerae bacterium]
MPEQATTAMADAEVPELTGKLESGLTARTWPVILYGALILMPANIYLLLVAGQSLLGPISFIALILWVEAARLSRRPLTTAEAFIVYAVSAVAAGQMLFYLYAIHPAYFRVCDIANSEIFSYFDKKLNRMVTFGEAAPTWWAPPREVVEQRSFLHRAWLVPILVGTASWIFHMLADLSMGVIGRELFIKVEKLPFPFAHPPADACKALTRDDPAPKRTFTVCGLIGTVWGLVVYFPVALGKKIVNYPIPWIDFNRGLHNELRGASFGIATDILAFTGGFIIPFRVVVSMLIGALAVQFVGNAWAVGGLDDFLARIGLGSVVQALPWLDGVNSTGGQYFDRYVQGMGIKQMVPNQLFVWMPVFIGAMVAAGLLHIFAQPRELIRTFKGLAATGRGVRAERTVAIGPLLVIFAASIVGCVVLFRILIPEFPWIIIAPFALFWSLLFSLIDIRAIGTTGFRVDPPYVREGLILAIRPENIGVWFAPWPIALGSSYWVQDFKTAELVGCTPRSLIIAKLAAYPVGMAANLLFISIFWAIAPIPSAAYPYADVILPVWANQLCIWISASMENINPATQAMLNQLFNLQWMFGTFAIFTGVYIVGRLFKRVQLSLIGLAVGMVMPIPFAVSLFIGGLVAKRVAKSTGPEWFGANRNVIVAGLAVGEGVVIGLFAAIAALSNSLVALPY